MYPLVQLHNCQLVLLIELFLFYLRLLLYLLALELHWRVHLIVFHEVFLHDRLHVNPTHHVQHFILALLNLPEEEVVDLVQLLQL